MTWKLSARRLDESLSFRWMVRAIRHWINWHMEQFDTFSIRDRYGRTVYVKLTREIPENEKVHYGEPL